MAFREDWNRTISTHDSDYGILVVKTEIAPSVLVTVTMVFYMAHDSSSLKKCLANSIRLIQVLEQI